MGRTQSREQAFILIFEQLFNPEYTLDDLLALTAESELFDPDDFTKELYTLVQTHAAEADERIAGYLKNWRPERLPKVSIAVLRLAVCEILFARDVPASVSANEAVNLAKKYAAAEDAAFINGVLGSLIRDLQV
ncbi:MAG: transcription antitermination factor NusB [Clostridia bacterium]|nr:transcription antitermination factor NusB [Clostridia bacterium]